MKKVLSVVLGLAIVAVSCYLYIYRPVQISNEPIILGHGGMGIRSTYPLNSQGSVNKAFLYNVDGVELDVRMSLDGVLFAIHDDDLEGKTDCKGTMSQMSSNDLMNCELMSWAGSEPLLSLNTLLEMPATKGAIVSFDIKSTPRTNDSAFTSFLNQLASLEKQFPEITAMYETSDIEILKQLQQVGLSATLLINHQNLEEAIELATQNELDGIILHIDNITKKQVQEAQEQGLTVAVWGCGSVFSNRKALELEPDLIQTDDIPSLMRILDKN